MMTKRFYEYLIRNIDMFYFIRI